jgi:hypothetical protein
MLLTLHKKGKESARIPAMSKDGEEKDKWINLVSLWRHGRR